MNINQLLINNVVIAEHGDDGVVCIVDNRDDLYLVYLCSVRTDLAADTDAIMYDSYTGIGYDMIVQRTICGWTYANEITSLLAVIPRHIVSAAETGSTGPNHPLDCRWEHKIKECTRFAKMIGRYLKDLLADPQEEGKNHD